MKRFQFHLEQVLRLKQQRQRLAEIRQQQAQRALDDSRSEVSSIKEQITQAAAVRELIAGEGPTTVLYLAQSRYVARLEQSLRAAEAAVMECEHALKKAAAARVQAAKEVETLTVLRERDWAEYRREVARDEQEKLDELSLRRWMAAQGATKPGLEIREGEQLE